MPPWVATAYLLAATALGPVFGALAGNVGRRPTLLVAIGLFVAGSIGSAMATGMAFLVAALSLHGAGAGGLAALPFVVVADRVSRSRRAVWSAFIATLDAIAARRPAAGRAPEDLPASPSQGHPRSSGCRAARPVCC